MKYRYETACYDGQKNLGSADWFKTEKKAVEVAKKDFEQFRPTCTDAIIRVEDRDGHITAQYRRYGTGWVKVQR